MSPKMSPKCVIWVWWLDHMGMMIWSYGYDGSIIWVWWLDHMGMMVGSYGYGGWVIWVWWLDHMGVMIWSYGYDDLIIWVWWFDHMDMMVWSYGYDGLIITEAKKRYYYYYYYYYIPSTYNGFYFVSMCSSSSLSLIMVPCVPILTLQWRSSPHILTQPGLSHDTLQWL